MDMQTSIAAMATSMTQATLMNNVNTSMMKKVMDTSTDMASQLIESMSVSTQNVQTFAGDVGHVLDVRA